MAHTPGPWRYRPYFQSDADMAELRKHGLEPTRALTNDGKAIVSAGTDEDRRPIAHVECQTDFKRGQGHLTDCAERDANARLIAAAPDLLACCELAKIALINRDQTHGEANILAAIKLAIAQATEVH